MALLFAVSTPFVTVLTTAIAAQRFARERTLAQETAMTQIEAIRALAYDSVGLTGGNPAGSVVPSTQVQLKGIQGTVQTRITYVDDPTPTGYVTRADYKKVVVTVLRTKDSKQLAQEATYIAPPGDGTYAPQGQAIVSAKVIDYALNAALGGATVNLLTGPTAPRSDVTDASGTALFPELAPNPASGSKMYYDLAATLTGYVTLPDDVSPGGAAHVKLVSGQTFSTILRVFKPATIFVTVNNPNGTLYTGAATVTVSSPRKAQTFAYTGSMLAITSLGGEPVVPSLSYKIGAQTSANVFTPSIAKTVPSNYPSVLSESYTLTLGSAAATVKTLTVTVKAGSTLVKNARVDVTGGPVPVVLTGITNTSGIATFNVPSGNSYTVTATGTAGEGTGTWSGNVTSAIAANVAVS